MDDIVRYIIRWLLFDNEEAANLVGYTDDPSEWDKYPIVILPNGKLGREWVYPGFENPHLDGKFVTTDIVYNTLFFTSRAEELINTKRDEHGRFLAEYSVLGVENRLEIPLADEYARFLTKALERACADAEIHCMVGIPKRGMSHVWLTHDIDTIETYRHLRGAIGGILRGEWQKVWASWQDIHNDPAYTFPWLMEQDRNCVRRCTFTTVNEEGEDAEKKCNCNVIYFSKHTRGKGFDYPQYSRHKTTYVRLRTSLRRSGASIGIHSSYYGFRGRTDHTAHRSHFLRCDIDNMQRLVGSGVTDDYTMMFADRCGFRLQTCRPVRWVNPKTMQLTDLTLHPLTVMDCTLSNGKYMNLSEDEAFFYCERLFEKIRQNRGELVLLWHNIDPAGCPYHKSLYPKLLSLLGEE